MAAWAIAGATLAGGIGTYLGGKEAAEGAEAGGAEERRQFDLQWGAQAPYRVAGKNALANMALLTGSPDPRIEAMNDRKYELAQKFRASINSNTAGEAYQGAAKTFGVDNWSDVTDEMIIDMFSNPQKLEGTQYGSHWSRAYAPIIGEMQQIDQTVADIGGGGQSIDEMVKSDPSYEFRFKEGQNALENYMSGGGSRWSGNALRGIDEYGQDFASQEYGNIFNRNANIAGFGPAATTTPQNNISAYLANQGQIRGDTTAGIARNVGQGITNWVAYDQNKQFLDKLGA